MSRRTWLLTALPVAMALLLVLVSCGTRDPDHDFGQGGSGGGGGTGSGSGGGSGTISLTLSDPTTCASPQGPFTHIFVTVTDVQASTNASAVTGDASLVDLTPTLRNAPLQVDLLGAANTQCFLAQLASATSLPAGSYQQVRVFLLSNTANISLAGNQCTGSFNCVVLASNPIPQTLQISAESTDGIILTGSQLASNGVAVTSGQDTPLNIDFNACESVVQESTGQFRLKAVAHAGEVSATASNSISGSVVDNASGNAITGTVIVALEQSDNAGIDRVIMQALTDSSGNFSFCPVAAGTYDIVAVAVSSLGAQFASTVTLGVQPGTAVGKIPLIAQSGSTPATITGTVNTAGTAGGANADVVVSALETAGAATATIPSAQQSETSATVTTSPSGACLSGSNCANYSLTVPADTLVVGTFSSTGTNYTQAVGNATYTVDGQAFAVNTTTPSAPNCSPSDVQVSTLAGGGTITVTAGGTANASVMQFANCR